MELALSSWEGRQDGTDLLGHYWEHLNVDMVEHIEAPPCSSLFSVDIMKYMQILKSTYRHKHI